jgi:hypothetical protein
MSSKRGNRPRIPARRTLKLAVRRSLTSARSHARLLSLSAGLSFMVPHAACAADGLAAASHGLERAAGERTHVSRHIAGRRDLPLPPPAFPAEFDVLSLRPENGGDGTDGFFLT